MTTTGTRSENPKLERQSSGDTWDWPLQHSAEESEKINGSSAAKKETTADEAGTVHAKNRRYSWEVDLDIGSFRKEEVDVRF